MSWNQLIGTRVEALVVEYLHSEGFTVIEMNWRSGRSEVDLIVQRKKELHFIEVKIRTKDSFGLPEERITKSKLTALTKAAEQFRLLNPAWKEIIFDVLSITILHSQLPEFCLIEDFRVNT